MKALLILIGALAIIVGVVAAGFFFLGYYNVAASVDDPWISGHEHCFVLGCQGDGEAISQG